MDFLLNTGGTVRVPPGPERPGTGRTGRVYILACSNLFWNVGIGLVDYIFIADRAAAQVLANSYDYMFQPEKMGSDWEGHLRKSQPKNCEELYAQLAAFSGIEVIEVPVRLIPMQRVGRIKGQLCLHKFCDSNLTRDGKVVLDYLNPSMPLCTKIPKT